MGKLLSGFTLGSVLTAALFVVLSESPVDSAGPAATDFEGAAPMSGSARDRQQYSPTPLTGDTASLANIYQSREAELQSLIDSSRVAIESYRRELRSLEADRFRQEQPLVSPLFLPPEFDWLSDADYVSPLDQMEREGRDGVWAASVEAQLNDYFADRPEIARTFGYPTIECRTSRCAVTFVLHGVVEDEATIDERFRSMVSGYTEQDWTEEFPDWPSLYSNRQDDVHTIYWSLLDMNRSIEVRRSQGRRERWQFESSLESD